MRTLGPTARPEQKGAAADAAAGAGNVIGGGGVWAGPATRMAEGTGCGGGDGAGGLESSSRRMGKAIRFQMLKTSNVPL